MRLVYIINANINFKILSVYILYKQYILSFIFCQYNSEIFLKNEKTTHLSGFFVIFIFHF